MLESSRAHRSASGLPEIKDPVFDAGYPGQVLPQSDGYQASPSGPPGWSVGDRGFVTAALCVSAHL